MSARDDMNQLLNHAVQAAGELIVEHGGFYPFGAGLKTAGGELVAMMARAETDDPGREPDATEVRDAVYEALRQDAEAGTYRAVCAVSDGIATDEEGVEVDAVIIRLEHVAHEPVLLALPYFLDEGQWAFGEMARAPYDEPQFFRPLA